MSEIKMNEIITIEPTSKPCGRCGRKLTNAKSIERCYGPICWSKVFHSEIESLDYIINDTIGIMVRDWNRALGVNVVILAERIEKQYEEISEVIIFTNSISEPAKSLADKIGISLYRYWDLPLLQL